MPEQKLQIESLRRLYATNRCAKALLDYAASKSGAAGSAHLTVDSLQAILAAEQTSVGRRELTGTLRQFAGAGCGRFVAGRRGQPSRFVWAAPLSTLSASVLGAKPSAATAKTSPPAGLPVERTEPNPGERGMFSHPFRLRPKLIVALNLPEDLTAQEADRLAQFITALPFKGGVGEEPKRVAP
jgi:hypothetical protein